MVLCFGSPSWLIIQQSRWHHPVLFIILQRVIEAVIPNSARLFSKRLWLEMFLNILISSILLIYTPHAHMQTFTQFMESFSIPDSWWLGFLCSVLENDSKDFRILISQFYHLKIPHPRHFLWHPLPLASISDHPRPTLRSSLHTSII